MERHQRESHFRQRANTLEKSEQIRPPPRRRRPSSHEFDVDNISMESVVSSSAPADMRPMRAGSVPPQPQVTAAALNPTDSVMTVPRIRRLTTRPKLTLQSPCSQPCSGHNTPTSHTGTSALDLSDLPFGSTSATSSESPKNEPMNLRKSSSQRRTAKWNWIWNKSAMNSSKEQTLPAAKISNSFLSRKSRKSRHISCPDITSVSSESSRSTSPVTFTLTSLFGSNLHYNSMPKRRRSPRVKMQVANQRVFNDFATEIVDVLRPVQYCQINRDPYEDCFFVDVDSGEG